jgi:hypothetical protein
MEQGGGVVRLKRVFSIGQQTGRFIAGGLHDLTVELRQGRRPPRMPAGLIAGLRQLCHNNAVALRGHREEAQAAGKRVVLGHREVFPGPVRGQAGGFVLVVDDSRFFHPAVDVLLSPIGSRDKAVKSCQGETKTHQAKAAGSDCDTDPREGNHAAV